MNEEKMDALKEAIREANEPETIMIPAGGIGEVSDGYHTFNELYLHRYTLFAVLCNTYRSDAWKSKRHADGSMYDYYFIAGIQTPAGMVTYHIELLHWDMFDVPELERAPEYDGHTSADVLERLPSLLQPKVRARTETAEARPPHVNELEATVPLMLSDDYRARFVAEYQQIKIRCERLERFCIRIRAAEIAEKEPPKHDCPLWVLEGQLEHMTAYLRDLKLRAEIEGIKLE
jgi:hypothetical protein